jgi:hypothetical protein
LLGPYLPTQDLPYPGDRASNVTGSDFVIGGGLINTL